MPTVTTLKLKQFAAVAGVALLVIAFEMFGQSVPEWIRAAIYSTVSGAVGKAFGQPIREVLIAALESLAKRRPDDAVNVAVSALRSLPPATAEAATARMFASLPPSARGRASLVPPYPGDTGRGSAPVIHFVHDDDVTADDLPPVVVRTSPPDVANDTSAASPSVPRGGTVSTDDDAVTHPNRPSRMR